MRKGLEVGHIGKMRERLEGPTLGGLGDQDGPKHCGLVRPIMDSFVSPEINMGTSSKGPIKVGKKWKKMARNITPPVEQRALPAGCTKKPVGKRERGFCNESSGSSDVRKRVKIVEGMLQHGSSLQLTMEAIGQPHRSR
ncbi:hypothetical protein CsSME_00047284 [Camellia sinensis var. sinensis]